MSHGEPVKVKFYLGIRPGEVKGSAWDPANSQMVSSGKHITEATAAKVWVNPPGQQEDMLVIPMELELPEEAFLPTMPTINISIPIESVGEAGVKVDGAVKRIDTSKKVERKLNP